MTIAAAGQPALTAAAAARVFARANALCKADAGKLWGVSLCVPMMLVDPQTRQAMLNRPVQGATPDGTIFRLTLAPGTQTSTAPFTYGGVRMAQLLWPMYGDREMREVTLMHESFHVVQPELGFSADADTSSIAGDGYLDTENGRIWLRGELHALRTALKSVGTARTYALRDALTMRLYRHAQSKRSGRLERKLDLLEGLAEATGIDAGLPLDRRIPYALRDISFVEQQPSYARSFPYATGPAYAELLDAAQPNWRRGITPASDIALTAMRAYRLRVAVPSATQAEAVIARYGGRAIESQEQTRAARKAALDAKYTRELVKGATLILPMTRFHITFNPRNVEVLQPYGSVYHTLSVTAVWGTIGVDGGDALIDAKFGTLRVAAPRNADGNVVRGNGWKITLASGYTIVPDAQKPGSFTVELHHE